MMTHGLHVEKEWIKELTELGMYGTKDSGRKFVLLSERDTNM